MNRAPRSTARRAARRADRRLPHWERLESRLALSAAPDFGSFMPGPFFDPASFGPGAFGGFDFGPDPSVSTPDPTFDPADFGGGFAPLSLDLGPVLSVTTSNPAPDANLTASPSTLAVQFDQPVAFWTVGFNDLLLDRINADGTTTPIIGFDDFHFESLDPTGQWLSLELDQPLQPGRYRLSISGYSGLSGMDGSPLAGGDLTVAEFQISNPRITLTDAVDLGTPDATPMTTADVLDLATNPTAVRLYKITLPAGHRWRLGLEVTAQRDGGTLDSALALFDAQGRPLAVNDVGRPDAPADPYLFVGLEPGTYYIGVSGEQNLPGQPGGYDPLTGDAGQILATQNGGPFRLHIVADPADDPISLLQLTVDRADPLNPAPTGFTLKFSGALGVDVSGQMFNQLTRGVELVDQAGRVWPIAAIGYNETEAKVSYLFLNPLPAGSYSLRLPAQGGLTDLSGQSPIAADVFGPRLPKQVLGTFLVDATASPADPLDLGPLFPNVAQNGVSRELDLAAGASADVRFVVIQPDHYNFDFSYSGGPISVQLRGNGFNVELDPDAPHGSPISTIYLTPGVYHVRITAKGDKGVQVQLTTYAKSPQWELLLANGVGQGPALGLRLIAPAVPDFPASPPPVFTPPPGPETIPPPSQGRPEPGRPTPTPQSPGGETPGTPDRSPTLPTTPPGEVRNEPGPETAPVVAAPAPRTPSLAANAGFSSGQGAAGLYLAPGGQPVGRPSLDTDASPLFSPHLDRGESMLAMGQSGLPSKFTALGLGDTDLTSQPPVAEISRPNHGGSDPLDDAPKPENDDALSRADPTRKAAALDPFAWLAQLRTSLNRLTWNSTPTSDQPVDLAAEINVDPTAAPSETREEPANMASLSPGQGIGLTVIVTVGYHRLFSRRALRGRRLKQRRAVNLLIRQS